jgi:hypothetical protein
MAQDFLKATTKTIGMNKSYLSTSIMSPEMFLRAAARNGSLDVMQHVWIPNRYPGHEHDVIQELLRILTLNGHVHVIEAFSERFRPYVSKESKLDAISSGQLSILKWMMETDKPTVSDSMNLLGSDDMDLVVRSISTRRHEIFHWFLDTTSFMMVDYELMIDMAAKCGNLHALTYIHSKVGSSGFCFNHCCDDAALCNHMDVLKWARSVDPPLQWSEETCRIAVKWRNWDVLHWLRTRNPPCPWIKWHCVHELPSDVVDLTNDGTRIYR